ncbi:MAG TPA: SDR family oxidoreductase [Candidatus Limnocylindrales bacterium]
MAAILVTGGTGTLGRPVIERLRASGHELRVLTRGSRPGEPGLSYVKGDLATGEGIAAAVDGVETIVHCAGSSKGDEEKTVQLVRAVREAKPHLVSMSVTGADRVPGGMVTSYFAMKLATEKVVATSGLPWTVLRASQFYDLVPRFVRNLAKLPVIPVPGGMRVQPIETDEVAERLVELALGRPQGLVPEMAGPKIYEMADLVRDYLASAGMRRPVLAFPLPGKAGAALRAGAATAPDHAVGKRTWEEFLAAH